MQETESSSIPQNLGAPPKRSSREGTLHVERTWNVLERELLRVPASSLVSPQEILLQILGDKEHGKGLFVHDLLERAAELREENEKRLLGSSQHSAVWIGQQWAALIEDGTERLRAFRAAKMRRRLDDSFVDEVLERFRAHEPFLNDELSLGDAKTKGQNALAREESVVRYLETSLALLEASRDLRKEFHSTAERKRIRRLIGQIKKRRHRLSVRLQKDFPEIYLRLSNPEELIEEPTQWAWPIWLELLIVFLLVVGVWQFALSRHVSVLPTVGAALVAYGLWRMMQATSD